MNVADMLWGIARRWYVVALGAVLAAVAAAGVWSYVGPTYERTASLLLLPGEGTLPEDSTNPYLYLGGLLTATDVVVRASSQEVSLADLLEEVPDTEILIVRDASTSAPVVAVTVSATSDADAERAMDLALDHVGVTLDELQTEEVVTAEQRISLQRLYVDDTSEIVQRSRIMYTAAVAVGILLFSLVFAALIDAIIRRRRVSIGRQPVGDPPTAAPETASAEDESTDARDIVDKSAEPIDDPIRASAHANAAKGSETSDRPESADELGIGQEPEGDQEPVSRDEPSWRRTDLENRRRSKVGTLR